MESHKHGKEAASGSNAVRATETAGQSITDRGSNQRFGSDSRVDGDNAVGTGREVRTWGTGIFPDPISGGILSRLIQQAEEKLDNANACIDWYAREKERAEVALDELRQLQAQLETINEANEPGASDDSKPSPS